MSGLCLKTLKVNQYDKKLPLLELISPLMSGELSPTDHQVTPSPSVH